MKKLLLIIMMLTTSLNYSQEIGPMGIYTDHVPKDLQWHFIAGGLTSISYFIYKEQLNLPRVVSIVLSAATGYLVADWKEARDRSTTGYNYDDIRWTIYGNITFTLTFDILSSNKKKHEKT